MLITERKLTDTELDKVNGIVKTMLKNKRALVSKYGAEAEKVMYGSAIKRVKKATNMDIEKLDELIRSALKRPITQNISESEKQESGLMLKFNNIEELRKATNIFEKNDLYFYDLDFTTLFFPEEEENYDELEKLIQDIMDKNDIGGSIEGIWNESLNENKTQIDSLLKILNAKKAGNEYKKALMSLIKLAEKKSGKTINTKKEALLALDYIEPTINEEENQDKVDIISMDVPLFIRSLEYAKEDAETDMDLHDFAEKAISGTKEKGVLTMEEYDELVGGEINEQEYAKDIEVQADEEEEYQKLKQDLNPPFLAKNVLKKLRENSFPQYSKQELLNIQQKLIDILNQNPNNNVADANPNNPPTIWNGKVSFVLKLNQGSRMSDSYFIKINMDDKEAQIVFGGYVNNTSEGFRKEGKVISIGNGTLEQEAIKIVQNKPLWDELSKNIHKERDIYINSYKQYMRDNPNDHT